MKRNASNGEQNYTQNSAEGIEGLEDVMVQGSWGCGGRV